MALLCVWVEVSGLAPISIKYFMSNIPEYYQHGRTEMFPFIPPTIRKVLDVGCGAGAFGFNLKTQFNCEVWGVEMNSAAAARASMVLDKVICSEFNASCFPQDPQFDCIFFNDVLEHMNSPEDALKLAKDLLLPNGAIVASIPNIRHFSVIWDLIINGEWKYQDAGILDRTHLRFFTRKTIVRFFEAVPLNVTKCQGINPRFVGRKHRLLNAFFPSAFSDMKFEQFAVVGRVI